MTSPQALIVCCLALCVGMVVQKSQSFGEEKVPPALAFKMKSLAAHRAGLKTVILPKRNVPDLDDLPDEVRNGMRFVPVDRIDEAIAVAFAAEPVDQAIDAVPQVMENIDADTCDTNLVPLAC